MSKTKDRSQLPPAPLALPSVIDAHTHLNIIAAKGEQDIVFAPGDPQIAAIVQRASAVGVDTLVTVAVDYATAEFAVQAAHYYPNVYAAVAIHPVSAFQLTTPVRKDLGDLAAYSRVVAIGETGLDWYWTERDPENTATREQQIDSFRWHIELAKTLHKPLMIHNRDADEDILHVLAEDGPPEKVIFHCFSSDRKMAARCIEQGFYLSISGTVTFKNSHELQQAAQLIPPELLLVETDAPFLTPHPYRGHPNEPFCLPYTVRFLAELRGVTPEELASQTVENTRRVYGM